MMHYRKGENVEKQLTKEELPFEDFFSKDTEFLWMHVNGGTKVNNVITYAKNALDRNEYKHIVWSGNGGGVVKTISCAEILKRSYPLYQVTRTCYTTVEENWKPLMEGLDEIVVNRQIPSLHIFMSLEPIEDNVKGLQKPNTKTDFWSYNNEQNAETTSSNRNSQHSHHKNRDHGRPKSNENQQNPSTVSNNYESSNGASSSSGVNKQYPQKRRRPNHNRTTQNPNRINRNANQSEVKE